jgi:3-isopropylmalate/(R)-2-methylmalate dehydratase large subunit
MTAKILGKASGHEHLETNDVVLAKVAMFTSLDGTTWIDSMREKGLRVWDPTRIVLNFDHFFQPDWFPNQAVKEHPKMRQWAKEQGIPPENIYDIGRNGISHQVPVEQGWALPGTVCIGGDTQSQTMGAANCFSLAALNAAETVLLTGDIWMSVPECICIYLSGALPEGVSGKDMVYRLVRDIGVQVCGRVIEFAGPGVSTLSMDVRLSICNGAVALGALTIIFPPDDVLLAYLQGRARKPFETVTADADAQYALSFSYDLSTITQMTAGPHKDDYVRELKEVEGQEIQTGYIGSCSAGRYEDLAIAAKVLRGRKVKDGVRLVVTPISADTMRQASTDGLLQIFLDAGATVTNPGCGACYVGNLSPLKLGPGERCISTAPESAKGRNGSMEAEIILANPAVVAASCIEGRIVNPVIYLEKGR